MMAYSVNVVAVTNVSHGENVTKNAGSMAVRGIRFKIRIMHACFPTDLTFYQLSTRLLI